MYMDYPGLEKNLQALQDLYPRHIKGRPRRLPANALDGLPVWIRGAVQLFELSLMGTPEPFLYLVLPEQDMVFEHLMRIYRQLAAKLKAPVLIIADNLPPKHRPLLVKFNIAFIYKNESVYAPELGLKFDKIRRFRETQTLDLQNQKDALTPFGLKLVAGLLTHQIPQEFTLKSLHEKLHQEEANFSTSKLSLALNELATHGLLLARGAGPTRLFAKNATQKTWDKILALPLAPFFREARTNYVPKEKNLYCIAGENALAHYSNLAEPAIITIAMSARDFRETYQESRNTIPFGDFGNPSVVQIWKERPQLFSINGVMNPIEVFFAMRSHSDERVQMSLNEMIKPYGLEKKEV